MPALSMTCACLHIAIRLQRRGLFHALQITIQRGNGMVQRPKLACPGSCEHHAHCRASGAHASQNDVGRSALADPQGTLRDDSVESGVCKASTLTIATASVAWTPPTSSSRRHVSGLARQHGSAVCISAATFEHPLQLHDVLQERGDTHTAAASNEHTAAPLWRFFSAATPKALGEWRFAVTHANDAPSSVGTVSGAAARYAGIDNQLPSVCSKCVRKVLNSR